MSKRPPSQSSQTGQRMVAWCRRLQSALCSSFETIDTQGRFGEDIWQRPGGGGGWTRTLSDGAVFERAGVNVSEVHGELSETALQIMGGGKACKHASRQFFATGISMVLHGKNPMVPTMHANFRYFERGTTDADRVWWFGGGADLTPVYLFDEDAQHFHQTLKDACDGLDSDYYPKFKKDCDDYFFLPHRKEHRGVGGVFFEDFKTGGQEHAMALVDTLGEALAPAYLPLVARRQSMAFGADEVAWQQLRRGRYVEFNLVCDRGTMFGLRTGGRVESILMSLPSSASWTYCHTPKPDSAESQLLDVLRRPKSWL